MRIRSRVLPSLIVFILMFAFPSCHPLTLLEAILCRDNATYGSISPRAKYTAFVYQRSCGATTGVATFVAIQPGVGDLKGKGEDTILAVDCVVPIGLYWTDETHLSVECLGLPTDRVWQKQFTWREVTIAYESYGEIDCTDHSQVQHPRREDSRKRKGE